MEIIVKSVHFLATHLWLAFIIVTIVCMAQIAIPILNAERIRKDGTRKKYKHPWLKLILSTVTITVMVTGLIKLPSWNSTLLYKNGKDGTGVITRMEQTNNMFNNRYVMRYFVVIKKSDSTSIEIQFESSNFNVYPSETSVSYPKVGEQFALRYLPSHPKMFVILANKKSEYTDRLVCSDAFDKVIETRIKFESDSLNKAFRQEYALALEQLLQGDCYKGKALKNEYIEIDKRTIERLKN